MLIARSARENFTRDEFLRIAFAIGQRRSAMEIAAEFKTTPIAIYRFAHEHGLDLAAPGDRVPVALPILSSHLALFGTIAARKKVDPFALISQAIGAVLADEQLAQRVIEKAIQTEPKRKGKAKAKAKRAPPS